MTTATFNNSFDTPHQTLDALAELDVEQLEAIYRGGKLPRHFAALNGKPKGRMLAQRLLDKTPLFDVVATLAKKEIFPWDGKSFIATGPATGEGINRIKLGKDMNWFPFKTYVVKSVIDGQDCLYLDYELPGNPWFIAKIRDELREVAPGLFLGPAMWKQSADQAALVLWFAIDANQQSK